MLIKINNSDLEIFNNKFANFLPKRIFDFHVHLWKKEFLKSAITKDREKLQPALDPEIIEGFTYEDFISYFKKIFPGREINGLFFGLPLKEVDLSKNNEYVSEICLKSKSVGLFIPEPDLKKIPEDFFRKGFVGFKPYPDLVQFENCTDFSKLDINISHFDFISREVLKFANEYGLILLIHIPRKNRLKDHKNLEELNFIGENYKNIKIVLAHAGRSYCYNDIKDSIDAIKNIKNLYVDITMINNSLVNKILIKKLGPDRILFGSDSVLSLLKGKNIEINDKHYFATKSPKFWSLSSKTMDLDFTFFIYEIIREFQFASEEMKLNKDQIEKVFYLNATKIIEDILNRVN